MIDALATSLIYQPLKFSRNRLEVLIDPADTTLTDRSSLRYALTLLVPTYPQSTELEELTTLRGRERPPQTVAGAMRFDGAQFRIDEVLDGFLESQKPAINQTRLSIIPTLTMPYCQREEVKGGEPEVDTSITRPKEWVFKGGLSNEDFAGWGNNFFDRYLRDTRQFLTWQPPTKTVSVYQPENLYFLLNASPIPAIIRRRVEVTYPDGRVDERTTDSLAGASLYSVVCVPAGMFPNGLGNDVASYKVWLSDGDDRRISEVRSYTVDAQERNSERFILIENSLGGFDTLRLLGQGEETTTVRRTTADTDQFGVTAIDYASLKVVSTEGDVKLTVSTGYFERDSLAWSRYLNELLLARSIYLVTAKGHVPLLLTTTELVTADDDTDLIARMLSFQKANIEQNFSQLPTTDPQPARAMAWRGVGFRHVLNGSGKRTGFGVPIRLRRYYTDDYSDVKPITEKPNVQGDADYLAPTPIPGVEPGSTPYFNAAIAGQGNYKRATCPGGQAGGVATINVVHAKYGGETQGDADALAEAEFQSMNTQAYADEHGSCAISENYTWDVPAGQWHIRFSHANETAIFHNDGNNGAADMGNTQSLQGQGGNFIYPSNTNDLNFPAGDSTWFVYNLGSAYANKRMQVYRNGQLYQTVDFTRNRDGFELLSLSANGVSPGNGDLFFLKFEDR